MTEVVRSQAELVERNKDKTNLQLALKFVEDHLTHYKANVERFLHGKEFPESRKFADQVGFSFEDADLSIPLQITPDETRALIARISPALVRLSALKTVDFRYHHLVLLPDFREDGILTQRKCCGGVPIGEFVNEPQNYHPHRILIGITSNDGQVISPTALPPTLSKDPEAVKLYQLHVMLHEFFHTIELPRRTEEQSRKVVVNTVSGRTFDDWAKDYVHSLHDEALPTSHYSGVYAESIFDEQHNLLPGVTPYDFSVREDMAEAWVASHFDIISNPYGYTSFANFPFGNSHPERQLREHGVASKRAALLKELRTMQ